MAGGAGLIQPIMFEYLSGKIAATEPGMVVLDVGGVGFKIHVPLSLNQKVRDNDNCKIFVSLSFRNEEFKLYGFITLEERKMFEKLQTVGGIGPATALNILSSSTVAAIYQAIMQEDMAVFKKIKGVGTKTAQRILLELKGKLVHEEVPSLPDAAPVARSVQQDAVAALVSLGYPQENAWEAVNKVWKKTPEPPAIAILIRDALAIINRKQE